MHIYIYIYIYIYTHLYVYIINILYSEYFIGKIITSFVFLTTTFKLLVILFIIKLYARVNVFEVTN